MITTFPQNQVIAESTETDISTNTSTEIFPLELKQAKFNRINQGFWDEAKVAINAINQASCAALEIALDLGQRLTAAKKTFTGRGEFREFRSRLNLTLAEARRCINLFNVFGGWDIGKIVAIASATNIYALCQNKYAAVVEQLRGSESVNKEFVKRLVKEFRERATIERQKKANVAQDECTHAVLQQHIDKDGTTYYTLKSVNLSDRVGSALATKLETQTIGQLLAEAVEIEPGYVQVDPEELQKVVSQALKLETENRLLLIENRKLAVELEQRDRSSAARQAQVMPVSALQIETNQQPTHEFLKCDNWEEFAAAVGRDRSSLLRVASYWTR